MMTKRTAYALGWTLLWALSFVALTCFSIHLTDGHLVYSIDDPLIHLAVAKTMLHGGYGVNHGEFSSPSSSILYPLVLAGLLSLGMGTAGPLLINFLAAGFSVWWLLDFFWRYVGTDRSHVVFANLASPLLIVAINAYALPLTGMENMPQVLLIILAVRGKIDLYEKGRLSNGLVAAIVLMPFVRFENFAFAAAALIAIAWYGRVRAALCIGGAIVAGTALWALAMHHIGLPFLPGSVLMKSEVARNLPGAAGTVGFITGILHTVHESFLYIWGYIFSAAVLAVLGYALWLYRHHPGEQRRREAADFMVIALVVVTLLAQITFGRSGWFMSRYETYAVATLVTGGIYLCRKLLSLPANRRLLAVQAGLILVLACLASGYAKSAYSTPFAARNMYEQQYQMQRFNRDFFPHRVAVNDLGWVAYSSDSYVLDLWGLGSEPVRKLKMLGPLQAADLQTLTEQSHIDYAMIYDDWFGADIPPNWCRAAILFTPQVTAGSTLVSFYATDPQTVPELNQALDRFTPTLPTRDTMTRLSCGHSYPQDKRTVFLNLLKR